MSGFNASLDTYAPLASLTKVSKYSWFRYEFPHSVPISFLGWLGFNFKMAEIQVRYLCSGKSIVASDAIMSTLKCLNQGLCSRCRMRPCCDFFLVKGWIERRDDKWIREIFQQNVSRTLQWICWIQRHMVASIKHQSIPPRLAHLPYPTQHARLQRQRNGFCGWTRSWRHPSPDQMIE